MAARRRHLCYQWLDEVCSLGCCMAYLLGKVLLQASSQLYHMLIEFLQALLLGMLLLLLHTMLLL